MNVQYFCLQLKRGKTNITVKFTMKYLFFIILLCFLVTVNSFGQSTKESIDSLTTALSNASNDTTKVLILAELGVVYSKIDKKQSKKHIERARQLSYRLGFVNGELAAMRAEAKLYFSQSKISEAIQLLNKALKMSKDKGRVKWSMQFYNSLGENYYAISDYDNSLKNLQRGLTIAEETKDSVFLAKFTSNIGVIYDEQGNYVQALNSYFKGLKIAEAQEEWNVQVNILINISTIYYQQQNLKFAIQHANDALTLLKSPKVIDKVGEVTCLGNLADFYFAQKDYSKSLNYAKQSLGIAKDIDDKIGLATAYKVIGQIKEARNKLTETLRYYGKALTISQQVDDKQGIVAIEREMAKTYKRLKAYPKALKFARKSLNNAKEIGAAKEVKNGYEVLSGIYEAMDKTDSAFYFYKKYVDKKDQLLSAKSARDQANIRGNFQLEKKEAKIILLTKENDLKAANTERHRIVRNFLIAGFIGVFILAFILYRNNLQKQRTNQLLQNKNDEINRKNTKINAQHEAITSSINYAQRIQQAILPPMETIQDKLPQSFIFFKPRDIVSGDFYWFVEHDDKYFFSVIDCTGHGVPGAFMSMLGNTALTNIVLQQGVTKPHEILNHLSKEIDFILQQHVTNNTDSMDMALCVVDIKNNTLEYAGANNPMVCIQNGEMNLIKADRMPIGKEQVDMGRSYTLHTVDISEPTVVYLFSDGYQDQFGGIDGKKFRSARLRELLMNIHHYPLPKQEKLLEQNMENWMDKGERVQIDDMLIMGVRLEGSNGKS